MTESNAPAVRALTTTLAGASAGVGGWATGLAHHPGLLTFLVTCASVLGAVAPDVIRVTARLYTAWAESRIRKLQGARATPPSDTSGPNDTGA